ncbi:c-type cytochrome [bacterium]|nr:c-type cytochrome [bacterium]
MTLTGMCWQTDLTAQNDSQTPETLTVKLKRELAVALAKDAREKGNSVQGAILFSQKKFNCVGCHAQGATNLLGPDLTRVGTDVPDSQFVESILLPSKVIKKGYETVSILDVDGRVFKGRIVDESPTQYVLRDTSPEQRLVVVPRGSVDELKMDAKSSMPEGLADQLESRQEFLDLVKYLMDIAASGTSGTKVTQNHQQSVLDARVQGVALLQQFHCTNCHATDSPALDAKPGPDLASVTSRVDPRYITEFILDPHETKPGTNMPHLLGQLAAAEQQKAAVTITHYLASLSSEGFQRDALDVDAAKRGQKLFHSVGCVACHSPLDEDGSEELPEGSVSLGDPAAKYSLVGLTGFLENPHAVRPAGRMPNLNLDHWEAQEIASYLLSFPRLVNADRDSSEFELDPSLAAAGKTRFRDLGCSQCHDLDGAGKLPAATPMSSLRSGEGCLSKSVAKLPEYVLSDDQRNAMQAAIKKAGDELTKSQQINATLQTLRCYACHERDGIGGVGGERDPFFLTTNENLGPQGRIPPPLTGVGAKLKPKWMRQVLVSGRAIRPYVETRMPQYGADHVAHLVDLFQQVDELPHVVIHEFDDPKEIRKVGTELVGSGGLNCIACHTFQQKPALTMPGVDLTEMAERLHKEWFFQYMRSPQAISPNTVMPSFWPGGKAIRKEILDGDTDQQIGAVWEYLQDGRQARVPRGLRREPIELLASEGHAAMLRRSYQGIGKRGIGVGYPGGVNLAFDAEQLRLAMIWKGKFADPAGVWRSQGHGTVRPLGSELIRFEAGPELDSSQSPWVVNDGRPPNHRFTGYFLDDMDRPTFTYQLDDVGVEDFSSGTKSEKPDLSQLKRKIVFQTEQPRKDLAFRLRTKGAIQKETDHQFRLGNALLIEVDPDHAARIVTDSAGSHLHIPLDLKSGQSQLTLKYTW